MIMDTKSVFPWLIGGGVLVAILVVPWAWIHVGSLKTQPVSAVSVIGEARQDEVSQEASFTAGVYAVNDDKNVAIEEVNGKIEALIAAVKEFGVADEDVKTQNLSIYQMEEPVELQGRSRTTPGQWRVSNDIMITLRDAGRAEELASVLANSGATNVYGPNFGLTDATMAGDELLSAAVDDAREKAQRLAVSEGRALGKVIYIQEEGASGPVMYDRAEGLGGGGGFGLEPGTQQVLKRVSVTWELR